MNSRLRARLRPRVALLNDAIGCAMRLPRKGRRRGVESAVAARAGVCGRARGRRVCGSRAGRRARGLDDARTRRDGGFSHAMRCSCMRPAMEWVRGRGGVGTRRRRRRGERRFDFDLVAGRVVA